MIFRQLFDAESSTYTYLIGDPARRQAALIDPVREQIDRDVALIGELGLQLAYVLDTHVHADHVTAAAGLRDRTGARTVAGVRSAPCADVHVAHGDVVHLSTVQIQVLATPGHTDDSVSYRVGDRVFTGDALLIRGTGRTDFQNGSAEALFDSLTRVLFTLPDETRVYPGHDYRGFTASTIGEERRFNPRIGGGATREQFLATMAALALPPPKKLQQAVPANRACGRSPVGV
jgi:glyoxylase-like metal-dependent hydrolase (beta-lactamase superfamily II)